MNRRGPKPEDLEIRRPGITEIMDKLRRQNPTWREERIRSKAKELWTERRSSGVRS